MQAGKRDVMMILLLLLLFSPPADRKIGQKEGGGVEGENGESAKEPF